MRPSFPLSKRSGTPPTAVLTTGSPEAIASITESGLPSGLPVVSTAVGGVPDLFESGKEGLIVRPGDVQGLSNSMAYLLENREARLSMGMAAAQRARENYDVSTMVQAYEELYEDVVNLSHTRNTESVLRKSPIPL